MSNLIMVTGCTECGDHYELTRDTINLAEDANYLIQLTKLMKFLNNEHKCLACQKMYRPKKPMRMTKFVFDKFRTCVG